MSDQRPGDTTTRAPEDASTPPSDGDGASARTSGGAAAIAPWVIAVVAAAVAIVALVQWWQLDGQLSADQEVREVAGQVVAALTNWESDDLEAVREVIDRHGTARFTDEAAQLLDQFAQGLQQAEARSTGEILNLVADADGGPAGGGGVALAVVRQEVVNASLEQPDVQCWGTRVVLQEQDGRWLVDGVELYGPNQCPAADDAPATGDTPEDNGDG